MIHAVLSNSLNPPYPSSFPPPPPRERDNNREGWLSRGITRRKGERGMTGFIISRELIASAPPSPPRLFIPSAHSACSSRLSVFSARMRPGHDTTNPPPPPPVPPRTAVSRRNFPDRRHDPPPPPSPRNYRSIILPATHELIVVPSTRGRKGGSAMTLTEQPLRIPVIQFRRN